MQGAWNPWHGCRKLSEGCAHCYVYRRDAAFGKDSSLVKKTAEFDLPIRRKRNGSYALQSGSVFACLTSDFFLEEADPWRSEAWEMIRSRPDVGFQIITKRVLRVRECMPPGWEDGWANVSIGATIENQRRAQERMDEFVALPLRERFVVCEPMLEEIDLAKWLASGKIDAVIAGGESGESARPLDYAWILHLRDQCAHFGIRFRFKQTGANFIKDGRRYRIERRLQMAQAKRAGIDISG